MNARRRLLAAASAAGALLALSACEKPAPIVTVVNEGRSVYSEANVWCFEGQKGEECAERAEGVTDLQVQRGVIGIDVGEEVAEGAWAATLTPEGQPDQQLLPPEVQRDSHYFSFDFPGVSRGTSLLLTVRALDEDGEGSRGVWQFRLRPR